MSSIETKDRYGIKFQIDKCGHCGGFWFDQNEIYRVPEETAFKLDASHPQDIVPHKLQCPRDNTPLREFHDVNLPSSIVWYRCSYCGGIFVLPGYLHLFKDYQKQRLLQNIALSRQSLIGLFLFFVLSFSFLFELFFLKDVLKADVLSPAINPVTAEIKQIVLPLTVFAFLFLLIIGAVYYWIKSKN